MIPTKRFRPEWILAIIPLAAPPALAQQPDPNQPDPAAPQRQQDQEEQPIFVFKVTSRMLHNGLDKLVEKRLAKDYDLDDYQREEMRQLLHEHLPKFLREHQQELQGLWVEWVEALSGDEPPDPEYVAEWSGRLLPIVEQAKGMIDSMSEDMREFLDDRQEVLLDGYLAAANVGTTTLTNRLYEFKEGGFDPQIHWPGYKHVRHLEPAEIKRRQEEMERARWAAMEQSRRMRARRTPQPAQPNAAAPVGQVKTGEAAPVAKNSPDEWTRYVEAFIRRYQLDDEQQQKARAHLQQKLKARDRYLDSKTSEFERIKNMFGKAGNERQFALAELAYQKLHQPLSRMFEDLKQRLNRLPTRAQFRAAALAAKKEPAPRQPAPTGTTHRRRPQ